MAAPVGRGGRKLEAALDRFALGAKLRGARAIDLGASTGGFTEVLLARGAARVLAVDVGHDQLHPSLRADPRVENLENTDWKTLPLSAAPGPFDFFTVDVSFVAARSMLRGLAFRLRDGAEGVVLVKPQFELPDKQVRDGVVTDDMRQRALERVRERAESLGFQVVASADSPVAGGSGTIELLAHLRFVGRSAKLPRPGERRDKPARPRPSPAAHSGVHRYFAVAAPGIEPVLAEEVRALLGAAEVTAVDGGVEFSGAAEVCWRANLWLRTASRVLVRLGELDAREFAGLRRGAAKLPWQRFLPDGAAVEIAATATRCRLYHTGAIAENLQAAAADRLGTPPPDASPTKLVVRGVGDHWTLSVDTSGELLHRRGWRTEGALAPLRETLAAALLLLCRWDPATAFYDPMCGAGTLALEACALAIGRAPGIDRSFAFGRWPGFDAARWEALRAAARASERAAPAAPIGGSDRAAAAVSAATNNATRAGLAAHVRFTRATLDDAPLPPGPGLLLCNPPYGRRVGDPRAATALYQQLGRLIRRLTGWRAAVLAADARHLAALGVRSESKTELSNGGLRVTLAQFGGAKKAAAR